MPLPKPLRGTLLNHSHPLARGLVGVWLFDERCGTRVFDASLSRITGTINGNPTRKLGKFGYCLDYDGLGDYIDLGQPAVLNVDYISIAAWVKWENTIAGTTIAGRDDGTNRSWALYMYNSTTLRFFVFVANVAKVKNVSFTPTLNRWYHIVATADGTNVRIYIDGLDQGIPTAYSGAIDKDAVNTYIGGDANASHSPFDGCIDHIPIYNRALTANEIARLYREPFAMFEPARGVGQLYALGQDVWLNGSAEAQSASSAALKRLRRLAGSAFAQSQASAVCKITRKVSSIATSVSDAAGLLKATRKIAASVGGLAAVNGTISVAGEILLTGIVTGTAALSGMLTLSVRQPWFSGSLEIERQWLREALFNCITTNAFKLGTVLTMGWFWVRVSGCSALYRGAGMGEVDFTNILALAAQNACEIQPPVYLPHYNNSTYFYVIRRFNNCGYQERTLGAAVKVSIDAGGELIRPQPNNIFGSKAEQVNGNKIQLVWFYCPLEQKSKPACFKIYWDSRTGQVGYENPAAIISYEGRKYYSYKTGALEAGRYLSAIRVEDAEGVADNSLAQSRVELHTKPPDSIAILSAGTV